MKFGRGYFITVFSVVLFAASSASADRLDVRPRKTGRATAKVILSNGQVLDQEVRPASEKKIHPLVKKALEVEADTKLSIDDRFMAIQDLLNEYEKSHDLTKKTRDERVKDPIWVAIDEVSHRIYKLKYPENAGAGNGNGTTNLMRNAVTAISDNRVRMEAIDLKMAELNSLAEKVRIIVSKDRNKDPITAEDLRIIDEFERRGNEFHVLSAEKARLMEGNLKAVEGMLSGNAKP